MKSIWKEEQRNLNFTTLRSKLTYRIWILKMLSSEPGPPSLSLPKPSDESQAVDRREWQAGTAGVRGLVFLQGIKNEALTVKKCFPGQFRDSDDKEFWAHQLHQNESFMVAVEGNRAETTVTSDQDTLPVIGPISIRSPKKWRSEDTSFLWFLPRLHHLSPNHEKTSHKSKLRDIWQSNSLKC